MLNRHLVPALVTVAAAALAVGAVFITVAVFDSGPVTLTPDQSAFAEAGAAKFAEAADGEVVSCAARDPERDNYVACRIQTADAPVDLLCAYRSFKDNCWPVAE